MNFEDLKKGHELFCELDDDFEDSYKKYVLNRRKIWGDLDSITEQEVNSTIIQFLKEFKIRNVKRITDNVLKLRIKLQNLSKYFRVFKGKDLVSLNFDEEYVVDDKRMKASDVVKEVYEELCGYEKHQGEKSVYGIGPTSASKILHGINPKVFMMWDKKIREEYGYSDNEIGYWRFLRKSQEILQKMAPELQKYLESNTETTAAKLLDEHNYMKFAKENKELPIPYDD